MFDSSGVQGQRPKPPLCPEGIDRTATLLLLGAFALLYVPSYITLSHTIWASDEQGHGPIILAASFWLLFRQRHELAAAPSQPLPLFGWPLLGFSCVLYAFGRSQSVLLFEVGSQIMLLVALMLLFKGMQALRLAWFPLFFLIFMVPLPDALVASVTAPLKSAVSIVVANLLYQVGYPIGHTGVILSVGPYQLMVADACAGLNSMFTLEALGLLYMNLMKYTSAARNVTLAVLVIPISFFANIVRVAILVLVTYHFGDEAGQGFVHGFAGMVLFMAGLVMLLAADKLVGLYFDKKAEWGNTNQLKASQ